MKKTSKKTTPKPVADATPDAMKTTPDVAAEPELVVFAFRLTRAERDAIHAAAGSAKASRFVRGLAIAGARGDLEAVQTLIADTRR